MGSDVQFKYSVRICRIVKLKNGLQPNINHVDNFNKADANPKSYN